MDRTGFIKTFSFRKFPIKIAKSEGFKDHKVNAIKLEHPTGKSVYRAKNSLYSSSAQSSGAICPQYFYSNPEICNFTLCVNFQHKWEK